MRHHVILDTDPGIDDALALFLAVSSPEIILHGLTTVFGNAHIAITTRNALALLERFNVNQIPVYEGAAAPLKAPLGPLAYFVHGDDALGNTSPTEPQKHAETKPAAEWMVEEIMKNPGEITIVAIAPLTNLAHALEIEPRIVDKVKEVVIMGGAIDVSGNVSPAAEANFANDPDAADIVFAAKWPMTLFALDVTEQVFMNEDYLGELAKADPQIGPYIQQLGQYYGDFYRKTRQFTGLVPHDILPIAYLLDPSIFTFHSGGIRVLTTSEAQGMSVLNRRAYWNFQHAWSERTSVKIAKTVDANRLLDLYINKARK